MFSSVLSSDLQLSFDTFVEAGSNRAALEHTKAAANAPGEIHNPLYIHGPAGTGKTHLLYAIASHIRRTAPDKTVLFVHCEEFLDDLVEAVRSRMTLQFRSRYCQEVDVLLIDDAQCLAGRPQTQKEFFYLLNTLYECKKQIVITADRSPEDVSALEVRSFSRFERGSVVSIAPPEHSARLAIARKKAKALQLDLDDKTFLMIADNLTDARQIEGALKQIRSFRDLGLSDPPFPYAARTPKEL